MTQAKRSFNRRLQERDYFRIMKARPLDLMLFRKNMTPKMKMSL